MSLNKKEKLYVENAYIKLEKDVDKFTNFIKENMGDSDKSKELIIYFNELLKDEVTQEEEEAFKKEVEEYNELKENLPKMSWSDKRKFKKKYKDVIKWLTEVQKMSDKFGELVKNVKEKRQSVNEAYYEDYKKQNEDAENLRREMIELVLMSGELLLVNDPNTGKEATYESLMKCTIDQLTEILEDNILELNDYLNKGVTRE